MKFRDSQKCRCARALMMINARFFNFLLLYVARSNGNYPYTFERTPRLFAYLGYSICMRLP